MSRSRVLKYCLVSERVAFCRDQQTGKTDRIAAAHGSCTVRNRIMHQCPIIISIIISIVFNVIIIITRFPCQKARYVLQTRCS